MGDNSNKVKNKEEIISKRPLICLIQKKKRLVETTYDSDVIISSDTDDIAVQTEKDASKRKRTSDTG